MTATIASERRRLYHPLVPACALADRVAAGWSGAVGRGPERRRPVQVPVPRQRPVRAGRHAGRALRPRAGCAAPDRLEVRARGFGETA